MRRARRMIGYALTALAGLLLQALAVSAVAQPIVIRLDPTKTTIEFTLADVLHTVHGTFTLKSGHFEVNPVGGEISGQAVVDAATGNSGGGMRDSRMKKNILEADRYPEITFTPTKFEGDVRTGSPVSVTVTGWFDIHGQRHQISIPMQVWISGEEASASGKFVVPYVAWGMKNPSTFILRVNEQVEIAVSAVGSVVSEAIRPSFSSRPGEVKARRAEPKGKRPYSDSVLCLGDHT